MNESVRAQQEDWQARSWQLSTAVLQSPLVIDPFRKGAQHQKDSCRYRHGASPGPVPFCRSQSDCFVGEASSAAGISARSSFTQVKPISALLTLSSTGAAMPPFGGPCSPAVPYPQSIELLRTEGITPGRQTHQSPTTGRSTGKMFWNASGLVSDCGAASAGIRCRAQLAHPAR
jgi:hypothetical protein